MIEKKILKLFVVNKDLHIRYFKYVNLSFLRDNYKLLYRLFFCLEELYKQVSVVDEVTFSAKYLTMYPSPKEAERNEALGQIEAIFKEEITNQEVLVELLEEHRKRSMAGEIAKVAIEVEEGKTTIIELMEAVNKLEHQSIEVDEPKPVEMNLEELYASQIEKEGLRWRVDWLNKSLGSLRKGDFGFVFARPETGKTTFLASEVTYMASQTSGDIIWANNEEQGNKVAIRCYQAALGITTETLFSSRAESQDLFEQCGGGRIKIFDYEDSCHRARIEAILKETNPALIIFDQIDKIKGFKNDRYDLELKAIYQWAREIAKRYAPVIAVCQAGGEAEGKLWLTMDHVDSSKTAKQGEADWILGIGKEQDNTSRFRYFNISKNKLLGDADTLPELRHGSTKVLIKPEVARYEEL